MRLFILSTLLLAGSISFAQTKSMSLDEIMRKVKINHTYKKNIIQQFGKNFTVLDKASDSYKEMYYKAQGVGFDFQLDGELIDAIIIHPQVFKGKDNKNVRFKLGLTIGQALSMNGECDYIKYFPVDKQLTIYYPNKAYISKQKVKIDLEDGEEAAEDGFMLEGDRLEAFLKKNKNVKVDFITIIASME
jgi:hypothetical protein